MAMRGRASECCGCEEREAERAGEFGGWGEEGSGVGALLDNSAGFLPNHVGEFVKQEIAV